MQLEVDANPIALYIAPLAAYIRLSPLSFSFIPVAVYIQRAVGFPRQAIDIAFDYVGKVNVVVTRDNNINALLILKVGIRGLNLAIKDINRYIARISVYIKVYR